MLAAALGSLCVDAVFQPRGQWTRIAIHSRILQGLCSALPECRTDDRIVNNANRQVAGARGCVSDLVLTLAKPRSTRLPTDKTVEPTKAYAGP